MQLLITADLIPTVYRTATAFLVPVVVLSASIVKLAVFPPGKLSLSPAGVFASFLHLAVLHCFTPHIEEQFKLLGNNTR